MSEVSSSGETTTTTTTKTDGLVRPTMSFVTTSGGVTNAPKLATVLIDGSLQFQLKSDFPNVLSKLTCEFRFRLYNH